MAHRSNCDQFQTLNHRPYLLVKSFAIRAPLDFTPLMSTALAIAIAKSLGVASELPVWRSPHRLARHGLPVGHRYRHPGLAMENEMIVRVSTKHQPVPQALPLRGGLPTATSSGYDPISLKNRPFHADDLSDEMTMHLSGICYAGCSYCPRPIPGKPLPPPPIDLSRLMAKFGRNRHA